MNKVHQYTICCLFLATTMTSAGCAVDLEPEVGSFDQRVDRSGGKCEVVLEGEGGRIDEMLDYLRNCEGLEPTLVLGEGHYDMGLVVLDHPLTIRGSGAGRTVLFGQVVVVEGVTLRLDGLSIWAAPYPGAVVSIHPEAGVTLENVEIAHASGHGVFQRGGTLHIRGSRIRDTYVPSEREVDERRATLSAIRANGWTATPDHVEELKSALDAAPGLGAGLLPELAKISVGPVDWTELLNSNCLGIGVRASGGAHVVVAATQVNGHPSAGIVSEDLGTFVEAQYLEVAWNGFAPVGGINYGTNVTKGVCFGGISVRNQAFALIQESLVRSNFDAGVVATGDGMVFFDHSEASFTSKWHEDGGVGLVAFWAALSAQAFVATRNEKIGIDHEFSSGILINGESYDNRSGIYHTCDDNGPTVDFTSCDISNNWEQDVYEDDSCSLGLPPAPPIPGQD